MRLFDDYVVLEPLKGGMAEAYKVRAMGDERVLFLKRVKEDGSHESAALRREVGIYHKLHRHQLKHVLEIIDVPRDSEHQGLVTEWADGGTLEAFVKGASGGRLPLGQARDVALEILEGLNELHGLEVVHRDLKPANIVRTAAGIWKIADFGISKDRARLSLGTKTFLSFHTEGYAPIEQLEGAVAHTAQDLFAFGKVVTFMVTGNTDVDQVPAEWRKVVQRCISAVVASRPTTTQIRELLP